MRLVRWLGRLIKRTVIGALVAAGLVFILFVLDLLFNEEPPSDEDDSGESPAA